MIITVELTQQELEECLNTIDNRNYLHNINEYGTKT